MPPATHIPPAMHAPLLPCMPPTMHTPHAHPLSCTPVMHTPLWTEGMIQDCENITFAQLSTDADGNKSSSSLLMSTAVHRAYHEMLDRVLSKTFTPAEK